MSAPARNIHWQDDSPSPLHAAVAASTAPQEEEELVAAPLTTVAAQPVSVWNDDRAMLCTQSGRERDVFMPPLSSSKITSTSSAAQVLVGRTTGGGMDFSPPVVAVPVNHSMPTTASATMASIEPTNVRSEQPPAQPQPNNRNSNINSKRRLGQCTALLFVILLVTIVSVMVSSNRHDEDIGSSIVSSPSSSATTHGSLPSSSFKTTTAPQQTPFPTSAKPSTEHPSTAYPSTLPPTTSQPSRSFQPTLRPTPRPTPFSCENSAYDVNEHLDIAHALENTPGQRNCLLDRIIRMPSMSSQIPLCEGRTLYLLNDGMGRWMKLHATVDAQIRIDTGGNAELQKEPVGFTFFRSTAPDGACNPYNTALQCLSYGNSTSEVETFAPCDVSGWTGNGWSFDIVQGETHYILAEPYRGQTWVWEFQPCIAVYAKGTALPEY